VKTEKYKNLKHKDGTPIIVMPIIVGKNCTLHKESRKFLETMKISFTSLYEEIGNLLGVYQTVCADKIYRKTVI